VTRFTHIPVLAKEVLEALQVGPGGQWVDGTCGGGSHSEAILAASAPNGRLWACDQDGEAVAAANARLAPYVGRFEVRRMNFAGLADWVPAGRMDGVTFDLGVSSHQLDTAERGFSYQMDGPLDMRMDGRNGLTAAEIVNTWPAAELARVLWEYGDVRESRRIARAIEADRATSPFHTTRQLAGLIERICPRHGQRKQPAAAPFMALRIAVNRELDRLAEGLAGAFRMLRPGGRLAVITFHSIEDRIVKDFMRGEARDYDLPAGQPDEPELRVPRVPRAKLVTRRPILPGEVELVANPRSRSAQLRVLEKAKG
jgi:16S rRNA (cytosine1402-N4)-methyltransferase